MKETSQQQPWGKIFIFFLLGGALLFILLYTDILKGLKTSVTESQEDLCGNGTQESWEECDDDNLFDGDGCNSECKNEDIAKLSLTKMFVTTETFSGDLGGIKGANAKCQTIAEEADLPGNWEAVLSDSKQDILNKLPDTAFQRLGDNRIIAKSKEDLINGDLLNEVYFTEDGEPYKNFHSSSTWTGTNLDEEDIVENCDDWTSSSDDLKGSVGEAEMDNDLWIDAELSLDCEDELAVYCYEVKKTMIAKKDEDTDVAPASESALSDSPAASAVAPSSSDSSGGGGTDVVRDTRTPKKSISEKLLALQQQMNAEDDQQDSGKKKKSIEERLADAAKEDDKPSAPAAAPAAPPSADEEDTDEEAAPAEETPPPVVLPTPFADVLAENQYVEEIKKVDEKNIMKGSPDPDDPKKKNFKSDESMNRAELAAVLTRWLFPDEIENAVKNYQASKQKACLFPDVSLSEWYAPNIILACSKGLVKGYPDRTFKPQNKINFVEAIKAIVEGAARFSKDVATELQNQTALEKKEKNWPWYKKYVETATAKAMLAGDPLKQLQEKSAGEASRGWVAYVIAHIPGL